MSKSAAARLTGAALLSVLLAGCSFAPETIIPALDIPPVFKEEKPATETAAQTSTPVPAEQKGQWQEAAPLEAADRGAWWRVFGDERLNELEKRAMDANPTLDAALARVEQARALARANARGFLPTVGIGANAVRTSPSDAGQPGFPSKPYNLFDAGAYANYEADLFGRLDNNERALHLDADAQEAAYRSVMLALQADVAQLYFSLRTLDSERDLLRDTIAVREEAARIMKRRTDLGDTGLQDFARTESELESARADLLDLDRQRAAAEHAMATLLGELPSAVSIAEHPLAGAPPQIPSGLPSALLTRRPDIAGAVPAMAAANARIGAAKAAFFPNLSLTATGGLQSADLSDLFLWSSRTWALGQIGTLALSLPIFDNGRRAASVDRAEAAYDEAVANYKSTVLTAFREVEDNLSDQRILAEQAARQDAAAAAATQTHELTLRRYDAGDADYFEVVDAQRTALGTQRVAVRVHGQRFITAIALIRALGGGWDMKPAQTVPERPS